MENIPPAPYPSQVEWQDDEEVQDDQNNDADSLQASDGGPSEEDLDIGEQNVETATRSTSKRSRKSVSRRGPSRVNSGSVIWTRAPPKKSYEPDPFLSIDNLPLEKKKQFIAHHQKRSTVRSVSQGLNVPFNSPNPATVTGAGRVPSSRMSSRPSTGSGWNKMVPKHNKYMSNSTLHGNGNNMQVKTPFKQHRSTTMEQPSPRPTSPGQMMKEKTAMATYHVARTIAKQRPPRETVISGRLLKAKLKPISTVKVEGPTINHCRGIIAGTRAGNANLRSIDDADEGGGRWAPFSYDKQQQEKKSSNLGRSRTLQRRQHILQTVGTGPLRHDHPERPDTSESRHDTSIASDEVDDRLDDLNLELEELERSAQEAIQVATAETHADDIPSSPVEHFPRVPTNSEVFITEEKHTGDTESGENLQEENDKGDNIQNGRMQVTMETKMAAGAENGSVTSGKSKRSSAKSILSDPGSRPQTSGSQRKVRFTEEGESVPESKSGSTEAPDEEEDKKKQDEDLIIARQEYGQGEYLEDENANNNNSTGKTEPLRMSVNDMMTGFVKPHKVKTTRPTFSYRPKSGKKTWEDVQKPDMNVSNLSISGKQQMIGNEEDGEECRIAVEITKKERSSSGRHVNSAASRIYNRGSPRGPQRVLGPREFMEAERRKEIERARPQSAMVLYEPFEVEPQPKAIGERPASPNKNVGLGRKRSFKGQSSRRVTSASGRMRTTKPAPGNTAVRSQKRCSSAHTHDPRIPVMVQCCVCVRKLKKYLSEEESKHKDRIMCKECQRFKGIVAEYNAIASVPGSEAPKEEPLAIEYEPDTVDESELGIIDDVVESDEEEQGFEVLTNMDDIERSLMEVRSQIKESHARYTEEQEEAEELERRVRFADENSEVFLTEAKDVEETIPKEEVEESHEEDDSEAIGIFSAVLTDCKGLPPKTPAVKPLLNYMQVYHFNQDDESESVKEGDITTYPVTYMGDEEGQGQAQGQGEGFLEMLMQELPKEKQKKPVTTRTKSPALEVKAQPARMTAAKTSDTGPASVAPFSPLCFKINARPPAGYLYYFAYGIDMNPNRFSTYIGRKSAERSWGLMMGFRLRFNRKAGEDAGCCFPNIEPHACSSVEGCLYLVTIKELELLDKHMGQPKTLQQLMLPVWLLNCDSPNELGVMQYCVPALMYMATDNAVHQDPESVDSNYTVDQCVKGGADVLSPAYTEHLEAMKKSPESE